MNRKLKVLIAEHDKNDIEILHHELIKGGLNYESKIVYTEYDYSEALKYFVPDIILSDYSFPSFDGPTAFIIRNELAPDTPFIFVSGTIGEEISIELIKNGVTDFVLKDKMFALTTKLLRALKDAKVSREKSKIEQDLKRTMANLAEAQSLAKLGSWDFDFAADKLTWSEQLYIVFDIDKQTFNETHGSFLHLIDEADREYAEKTSKHTQETGEAFIIEYGITTHKGEKRVIQEHGYGTKDAAGKVIRLFGTAQDITERKKAAKTEYELHTRLKAIFEKTNDAIMLADDSGNYVQVNPAAAKMLGYSQQELTGMNTTDIISGRQTDELWNEFMQDGSQTGAIELVRKDGSLVICHYNATSNILPGLYLSILTDITEQKKAENAIKESEAKYRAFFENSMDGILLTVTDGSILAANPAACAMFRMTEDEICAAGRMGLVDLSDPRVEQLIKERQKSGKASGELTYKRKDGTTFPGEISSVLFTDSYGEKRTSMIVRDISERKETEENLALTSAELQYALNDITKIMDSSLDVICAVDAKGNFLKVSAASEAVWGYKPKELIGKPLIDFVYHEDKEKTQLTADNVMRGNKLNHFENRYVRKDGSLVPIEWSARWDEKDQVRYGIARDVTEKKRLQKAFEIERQQFYDLFSEAPSSMGILSGPDHRFEMANPLYLQLIGKKDIIGKSVKDVLPEIEDQGFIEILDSVYQTGKAFSANEMLIKLDVNNAGKPIDKYLNFIYQPHIGSNGKLDGILFFAVDVTEQVLSRKKIEESEKEVRAIAESMPQIVWVTTADGKNIYFNHQWVDYTGLTLEESLGDGWLLPFHEQDKPLAWEAWNNAVKTLSEYSVECRLQKHDGSYRWWLVRGVPKINENGKIVKWYGTCTDIEKIKEKEKQLAKSELFNRSVINSITDHIAVVDEQGIITTVNNAWEQFALKNGETRMERIGKGANYFRACEKASAAGDTIAEAVLLGMKDVLNEKQTIFYLEYPCHSPKEERWFGVRVMKFEGKEHLIITLHIDITDRKKEEKEKEKITLDLVQRNKNLEQFSYIVSHNLRAPVANILGFAELMKYENANPEFILDSMKGMSIAAQNLDNVMKEMMTILHVRTIVSENKEEILFQNLIEGISLSIDNIIKKENVIIRTDFKSIDRMLSVKSYLYSIFYNLIINSIKFHKPGVRPLIEIQSQQTPTGLCLIFKDNGIGIDLVKHKESLFGLYKRFHSHIEGKGMGMFMIKTQVEAIGGKISITSEVNKGTEFTIEFENINR